MPLKSHCEAEARVLASAKVAESAASNAQAAAAATACPIRRTLSRTAAT